MMDSSSVGALYRPLPRSNWHHAGTRGATMQCGLLPNHFTTSLAHSDKLPTGLYILLALISFFFLFLSFLMISRRQIISGSAGLIIAFWVQMINLDFFFRYLDGRCHDNLFCGKLSNFVALAVRIRLEIVCDLPSSVRHGSMQAGALYST